MNEPWTLEEERGVNGCLYGFLMLVGFPCTWTAFATELPWHQRLGVSALGVGLCLPALLALFGALPTHTLDVIPAEHRVRISRRSHRGREETVIAMSDLTGLRLEKLGAGSNAIYVLRAERLSTGMDVDLSARYLFRATLEKALARLASDIAGGGA